MQLFKLITMLSLLLASGILFAHAQHAIPPSTDFMHLLAHYWPVLLLAIVIFGVINRLRRYSVLRQQNNDGVNHDR